MEATRPRDLIVDQPPIPLDLSVLEAGLRGSIVRPTDAEYDAARQVWQAAVDRRPAVIVRAADAWDVSTTVRFAAETGRELAVRSGGHSLAGYGTADGAIVLDLGAMKGLHIDPERRLAWAQPGLTAGEYTVAASAHGLATPFGDTGSVGIAGLTLGGGIGWLARKHGLAIDHLVAAEVVTADGRIIVASESSHPDLFWAIRGGGGNFGVVTRFQFRLVPVGEVLGGALFLPPTPDVIRGVVAAADAAPEELTTITFLMAAPPLPFVPAEQHGKLTVMVMFVWAGDPAAGQVALAPFRALAQPIADLAMPMPYPGIYEFTAAGSQRGAGVHRSLFLDDLDDEAIEVILERMAAAPSPMVMTQLRVFGGAMARVPADATAFAHRGARIMLLVAAMYEGDAAPHAAWVSGFFEALAPRSTGVYSNFLEDEGDDRVREAYPAETYARLAAVKRRYDPRNLFHLNQNIRA